MTLRDAAQRALEVVTRFTTIKADDGDDFMVGYPDAMVVRTEVTVADLRAAQEAQSALRAALAECDIKPTSAVAACSHAVITATGEFYGFPKREWQSLSDDDIALIVADCSASAHRRDDFSFARAIEAALKEKNNG